MTTDEDALQMMFRQKALNFAPGSDWLYSNRIFLAVGDCEASERKDALGEYAAAGMAIHFDRAREHRVTGFTLDAERTRGLVFAWALPGKI